MARTGKTLLIITAFFSGHTISGQNKSEQKDTTILSMDEIVITVNRHQQKILLSPYSVNTVSQDCIDEMNPRTVPEALTGTNGVFVQKTNHGGGSLFVRGLTGNQTLILVDGIRLNNSTFRYGPNQYLNTIDLYTISRIEVARGTGSVQYGTDAIGGVVQLLTHDPKFSKENSWQGRLIGKYITGDMEKTVRAEANYQSKKFALLIGSTKRDFGDLIGGDTTGRQSPSGYDEWSLDVKAKYLVNDNIQLTAANQILQQNNVPVYHKLILEDYAVNKMDPQFRLLNYIRVNSQWKSKVFKENQTTVSFQRGVESRLSRKNGSTLLQKEEDKISTLGFTSEVFSAFFKVWTANSGLEFFFDKVGSEGRDINFQTGTTAIKRGLYPDGSKYGNYSLYSLHHLHYRKWIMDAGIRFNTFNIRVADTALGAVKLSPSAWVTNFGLMYEVDRDQKIYAAFSNGFRAPNIDDMGTLGIVDFRYEIPTYNLVPEKSQHSELGYKFQTKNFSGTLNLYYLHINNLITRVRVDGLMINGYQVYQKENTESALIKGFETEFNWNASKNIKINGGVAYSYGQNLSKKEPLRRIPPFNGRLIGSYRNGKWFAATEFQFASMQRRLAQGDKDDNRIPEGGTPGWCVFNIYAGYKLSVFQFNAGLQNIFNEDYRTHGSGINAVGRSAWLSMNINFR